MKLLRPLHRQRRRRRTRITVLGNADLALYYGVRLENLEHYLLTHKLPFHKDSCGNIWASCEQETQQKILDSKQVSAGAPQGPTNTAKPLASMSPDRVRTPRPKTKRA